MDTAISKWKQYRYLTWTIAITDFKLRYHGSLLGYIWALLKPLIHFSILFFVFSSIFSRGGTNPYYSLELLTGLTLFNFFNQGTTAGMKSLVSKAGIIKKIQVPHWILIVAASITSFLIFAMNITIIIIFFLFKGVYPSFTAIVLFLLAIAGIWVINLSFGFLMSPLFVRFRDLGMIWEVLLQAVFYASPIIYPLTMMPEEIHKYILINPIASLIHFTKESFIYERFLDAWQYGLFAVAILLVLLCCMYIYSKTANKIAENI